MQTENNAVGAPVEAPVRPDPFRDWVTSLTPADVYDFDSEGRGYKKDAMLMMRMAWNAATARERTDNEQALSVALADAQMVNDRLRKAMREALPFCMVPAHEILTEALKA